MSGEAPPAERHAGAITLDELAVAAAPEKWAAAGFATNGDGVAHVGSTRIRLAGPGAGRGIVGWSLRRLPERVADLDGLPVTRSSREAAPPGNQANGAHALDHVVAFTPLLDRTVEKLKNAGLDLRRVRDAVLPGGGTRQAFFRLGDVILEVIEQPAPDGSPSDPALPARLWGLAFVTADLDDTAGYMGDRLGEPREAVQPGRRIATVRRGAYLGVPVAFLTPAPR